MEVEGCGAEGKDACHASDLEAAINAQKLAELEYDPSGQKQKRNSAVAETILYGGSELLASILFEPADWGFTAYHCANGDCSAWMLLGLLPIIPSTLGRHADDTIDLYRAVSKSEMDDILTTGVLRPKPGGGSMDAKWLWETYKGAKEFAKSQGLDNVLKVTVPRSVLDFASQRWSNLDQLGPAVSFMDEALGAFNQAIISIAQVWSR